MYKVKRNEDGQEYALKKVKIQNLSDREKENALNEVRILASITDAYGGMRLLAVAWACGPGNSVVRSHLLQYHTQLVRRLTNARPRRPRQMAPRTSRERSEQ